MSVYEAEQALAKHRDGCKDCRQAPTWAGLCETGQAYAVALFEVVFGLEPKQTPRRKCDRAESKFFPA